MPVYVFFNVLNKRWSVESMCHFVPFLLFHFVGKEENQYLQRQCCCIAHVIIHAIEALSNGSCLTDDVSRFA